jgi:hypothetical protein
VGTADGEHLFEDCGHMVAVDLLRIEHGVLQGLDPFAESLGGGS